MVKVQLVSDCVAMVELADKLMVSVAAVVMICHVVAAPVDDVNGVTVAVCAVLPLSCNCMVRWPVVPVLNAHRIDTT